jgi:hypothetical protein
MDPYTPPRADASAEVVHEDDALGGPGPVVGLAGAAMAGAGILTAASGWQLGDMLTAVDPWVEGWMWSFLPLGVALAVCGGGFTQARGWALRAGTALAAACAASGGAWLVFAALRGVFTLAALTAAGLSMLAVVLALVALPDAERVARARARLLSELS